MKKFLGIFLAAILCVMMAVAVNAADVYVNDGGSGDGTTAETPFGSMDEAIEAVAAEGGTVHIVDTYTCPDQYTEPAHAGDIVITGGKYVFTNGSYNRWYLSGEGSTTFENITFEYGAGSTSLFISQFNELIIGEGVTFPGTFTQGEKEVSGRCYILGGYQYNKTVEGVDKEYASLDEMIPDMGWVTDKDSHITVKSGNIWCVAGFNRGAATADCVFTGTSYITIDGGFIESAVYGGNINGSASAGATVINVNGGEIAAVRLSSDDGKVSPILGDAVVNVNGGSVTSLVMNNVLGKTEVTMAGGSIGQSAKTFDATLDERKTENTVTILNIAEGATVLPGLAMNFDTVNGEVSSPIIPTITKEAEETTAEVADTTAVDTDTTEPAEGGVNPVVIVVVVLAVVVVVAIVVVTTKKKK